MTSQPILLSSNILHNVLEQLDLLKKPIRLSLNIPRNVPEQLGYFKEIDTSQLKYPTKCTENGLTIV